MPKFFISKDAFLDEHSLEIVGDDASHVSRTLRMKVGEEIVVTDSSGFDYRCHIESFTPSSVVLKIDEKKKSSAEGDVRVSLFQALVKYDKMDTVIQKSVELGVYDIFPVEASRCVVKLDDKTREKKVERWNKIAREAAKQCGRGIIPVVHDVIPFKKALELMSALDESFVCYECEDKTTLKAKLSKKDYSTLGFFIGPEGGISLSETELISAAGIDTVSLGNLILRTETAGPAVLSMILYETRL